MNLIVIAVAAALAMLMFIVPLMASAGRRRRNRNTSGRRKIPFDVFTVVIAVLVVVMRDRRGKPVALETAPGDHADAGRSAGRLCAMARWHGELHEATPCAPGFTR